MPVLATSTPPNRPSAGRPAAVITTQNEPRMRLNSVSVFERTMLAYERLVAARLARWRRLQAPAGLDVR